MASSANPTRDDFAALHPGGRIGRRLLLRVQEVMVPLDRQLPPSASMQQVVVGLAHGRGIAVITDAAAATSFLFRVQPRAGKVAASKRLDIDSAGQRIWAQLPPEPGIAVIAYEVAPEGADARFGNRVKLVDEEDWRRALV